MYPIRLIRIRIHIRINFHILYVSLARFLSVSRAFFYPSLARSLSLILSRY